MKNEELLFPLPDYDYKDSFEYEDSSNNFGFLSNVVQSAVKVLSGMNPFNWPDTRSPGSNILALPNETLSMSGDNFQFEQRMLYLSEKISELESKFSTIQPALLDNLHKDKIYNLKFDNSQQERRFYEKYAFAKYVYPKHKSHFEKF